MKSRRMFWRIVDEIEALIDSGDFAVGSRLPPERELAEKFDVSRPTIRVAIIALEVREKVEVAEFERKTKLNIKRNLFMVQNYGANIKF